MTLVPTVLGPIFVDDKGSTGEPVALLWPSLFTDHSMWDRQIAVLREAGWRTLALDPPGHGQSRGPARRFTMDECAEAALQVLDAQGVSAPVLILGTSWGGFVAPRIALRAPERVRGLILFNTSAERPLPAQRVNGTLASLLLSTRSLGWLADRVVVPSMLASETRNRRPDLGRDLTHRVDTWDRAHLVSSVRSVLLDRDAILDALPEITCQVLIVSGGRDTILPTRLSRRMAAKFPQARHVVVPEAAHLIPLEAPEAANALVLEFVNSMQSPSLLGVERGVSPRSEPTS